MYLFFLNYEKLWKTTLPLDVTFANFELAASVVGILTNNLKTKKKNSNKLNKN